MKELFGFLVTELRSPKKIKIEDAIARLGLRGRILDVNAIQTTPHISDNTKAMVYVRQAIGTALRCPVCEGLLDPTKSVSYDHIVPRRKGGTGDISNTQMAHPYCNSNKEALETAVQAVRFSS
jgi:5-methylcytosine-specific restriction endonuclease McrA